MAIDSKGKRMSAMNAGGFDLVLPDADSSVDQTDRQHLLEYYSGILAGAAGPTLSVPVIAPRSFGMSAPSPQPF